MKTHRCMAILFENGPVICTRLTGLTLVCKVIRYHLVQVRQKRFAEEHRTGQFMTVCKTPLHLNDGYVRFHIRKTTLHVFFNEMSNAEPGCPAIASKRMKHTSINVVFPKFPARQRSTISEKNLSTFQLLYYSLFQVLVLSGRKKWNFP